MNISKAIASMLLLLALAACASSTAYEDGCHGVGCLVDDPDNPETWPMCSDGARHPDCSYAPEGR